MSHASMAGYFLFFYNRYRKEEILKRKEEKLMSLLEVKNVKKIYTTRFGSNQVEALRDVNFTRGICCNHGRVWIGKDDASEYSGGT